MLTIAVHRKLTLCSCACWTVSDPWCPSSSDTRWIVERKQEGIMERCPCFIKTLRPAHWQFSILLCTCNYKQTEVRNKSCVSLSNVLSASFKSWGSRIKNCQKRRMVAGWNLNETYSISWEGTTHRQLVHNPAANKDDQHSNAVLRLQTLPTSGAWERTAKRKS